MPELRKAKLRVYVTVEGQKLQDERVHELVIDYQRLDGPAAGPLNGVWTTARATAWASPSYRLGVWTDGRDAPSWVVDIASRFSPDQELAELQELGVNPTQLIGGQGR